MVRVHVQNGSTLNIGNSEVASPAVVDCDTFTLGTESWENGVLIVTAYGAELVATRHPNELARDPYTLPAFVCILFVLGLLWSRASISR